MSTLGIVGAGTMGAGIAGVAAGAGYDVLLHDLSESILTSAAARISDELEAGVARGKLQASAAAETKRRIRPTSSLRDLSRCNIVIEAAAEAADVKKEIFRSLDGLCTPPCILVSNTSSLSITALSGATTTPERVVGMHFFNPPRLMKLVEIVRGHSTSSQTVERAVDIARQLGKVPVVVSDTPGFIVNRVARPFYGEALRLLGEGVASVEDIDRIVKSEGGFRMGPFELMDLIGIDVNLAVTKSIYEQTFGEPRYRPHVIQQRMVDAGLLGKKSKRGFYRYDQ